AVSGTGVDADVAHLSVCRDGDAQDDVAMQVPASRRVRIIEIADALDAMYPRDLVGGIGDASGIGRNVLAARAPCVRFLLVADFLCQTCHLEPLLHWSRRNLFLRLWFRAGVALPRHRRIRMARGGDDVWAAGGLLRGRRRQHFPGRNARLGDRQWARKGRAGTMRLVAVRSE